MELPQRKQVAVMPKTGLYQKVREMVSGIQPKDSPELYQAMVDTAAAGMVTIDEQGTIQACNPALCRIFGYETDELIGQAIETLMPRAYARHHQAHLDRYREQGEATVMGRGREVKALRKTGEEFSVHLSVSEMTFAGARCFTGVVHDLSAAMIQARPGYNDQSWISNVLDHTPASLTVKDNDGRYLLLNRKAEQLFQVKADQVVGHTDAELFDPHWANTERHVEQDVIRSGCSRINIQPIVLQQQDYTLLVSKTPLHDASGHLLGVVSLSLDISALSSLQPHTSPSDAEMLDLLPQALALVADNGDILQANQAYAQRFGMNAAALQNCNLNVVESDRLVAEFQQLVAGVTPFVDVAEAGLAALRLQKTRLRDQVVILLSETSFAAEEEDAQTMEAPVALTNNAHFIASLSHELRTPLNSVIGFSQILKNGDLNRSQAEAVGMVERAGKHLVALVDQVLDLIKLEGNVYDIQHEAFALQPVINECLELVSSMRQRVEIHQAVTVESPWLRADRIRVKQILLNLLTNALKYNRNHHDICLEVNATADGRLELSVIDQGLGIANEYHDRVFQPFERLSASNSLIEGNGLGLVICRQLAEQMHGELNFTSVVGQGSTFTLTLPAADPLYGGFSTVNSPSSETQSVSLDALQRVLYIEDNAINARFVELGFQANEQVDITIASTGKEGVDKAIAQTPDVILLDMRLPDIHGLDVLKQLRQQPQLQHVRIYGVSADALPGDIHAAKDAGLDGYMTKPLDLHQLNAMICH